MIEILDMVTAGVNNTEYTGTSVNERASASLVLTTHPKQATTYQSEESKPDWLLTFPASRVLFGSISVELHICRPRP